MRAAAEQVEVLVERAQRPLQVAAVDEHVGHGLRALVAEDLDRQDVDAAGRHAAGEHGEAAGPVGRRHAQQRPVVPGVRGAFHAEDSTLRVWGGASSSGCRCAPMPHTSWRPSRGAGWAACRCAAIEPAMLHATLVFCGPTDEERIAEIVRHRRGGDALRPGVGAGAERPPAARLGGRDHVRGAAAARRRPARRRAPAGGRGAGRRGAPPLAAARHGRPRPARRAVPGLAHRAAADRAARRRRRGVRVAAATEGRDLRRARREPAPGLS